MSFFRFVSALLIVSILSQGVLFTYADDTEADFNSTKTHVNAIQVANPNLPNVPQQKGRMGEILSKLFDSNGKIGNWYLKALGPREDGAVLRWTGGAGGRFMTGSIYDTGTRVGIGTSNPNALLHINSVGSTNAQQFITAQGTGEAGVYLDADDGNLSGGEYGSIRHLNDLSFVLSNHTNQPIHFNTNGGTRMTVSGVGNVGIGNTGPNHRLDVSGDINFTGDLRKNGVLYNPAGRFQDGATAGEIYYNGGFVGIGNNNPSQMLDVTGNANISGTLTVGNLNGDSITDGTIDSSEIQNNSIVNADVSPSAAIAGTKISPNFGNQDIIGESMLLNKTGTTWGQTHLSLENASQVYPTVLSIKAGNLGVAGLGILHTGNNYSIVSKRDSSIIETRGINGISISAFNSADTADIKFETSGTTPGEPNPKVIIKNNGNVGVGIVTPNEKLSVSGRISVTTDPDSNDDVGNRGYNDGRYVNVGEAIPGDVITDGTIDSSEIQNNTLTASDLAPNSVGNSELNNGASFSMASLDIVNNNGTTLDIIANDAGGAPASAALINIEGYEGRGKGIKIKDEDDVNEWFIGEGYDYTGIGIGLDSAVSGQSEYGANAKLFVQTTGNVGIGTTTPSTKLHVTDTIRAGTVNSTQGQTIIEGIYSGQNVTNTLGAQYSSAATTLGYGVRPKQGATGYVSSAGNAAFSKGSVELSNQLIFRNAPAATVAIDSDVAMTERMRVDASGNLTISGTMSGDSITDGTIDSSEIQNNTLTASDLAANSVGNSELADTVNINVIEGVSYIHGDFGNIARSTDEWLRLNNGSEHTNGVYVPNMLRADGGLRVSDDEGFYRSAEDVVSTDDTFRINGRPLEVNYSGAGNVMTLEGKEFIRKMTDRGGVRIGADDVMVIGDGESPDTVSNNVTMTSEQTYITSDNTIHFYSAQQGGFNASNRIRMNGSRIDDVTCIGNCF